MDSKYKRDALKKEKRGFFPAEAFKTFQWRVLATLGEGSGKETN